MMLGQEMLLRLLFYVQMALAAGLTGALMLGAVWQMAYIFLGTMIIMLHGKSAIYSIAIVMTCGILF